MKIVWLHGYGFDHQIWKNLLSYMPGHEHVCPDFAGFGTQKLSTLPNSMKEMAEWLNVRIELTGVEPFLIIGHSMGGYVALEYLNRFQNNSCKGLVLLHSHCFADDSAKITHRQKQADFIRQHGSSAFLSIFYPGVFGRGEAPSSFEPLQRQYLMDIDAECLATYQEVMASRADHSDYLRHTRIPVLCVHGAYDALISLAFLEDMIRLDGPISKAILAHSGHMGMLEEPEVLSGQLKIFFEKIQNQ